MAIRPGVVIEKSASSVRLGVLADFSI